MNAPPHRAPKLGVEVLEAREVPAIASVVDTSASITITADDGGSNVTISRPDRNSPVTITDNQTGHTWTFSQGPPDFKLVVFIGGRGSDRVVAANAVTPVELYGRGGNDLLVGGWRNDHLDGGGGNDRLMGGGGNDALYGRNGNDLLRGQSGSDFLDDGGAPGDHTEGGPGYDFLARTPVRNGTTDGDVKQGDTPTCWVLSPLAAAARAGINLARRITYLGNGDYRVKLLKENGGYSYQTVNLEGGRLEFEPKPNGNESWVILFHRAVMQEMGVDWKNPDAYDGGGCWQVMPFLTGRPAESHEDEGRVFDTSSGRFTRLWRRTRWYAPVPAGTMGRATGA